jgi:Leucine Rich repeat
MKIQPLPTKFRVSATNQDVLSVERTVNAEVLATNTTATFLSLLRSGVGDVGVSAIADALTKNRTLETLCLSLDRIGDTGAVALAAALRQNTTLELLDLGGGGEFFLVQMLDTLLSVLGFGYKRIGNTGASAMAETLHHNKSLQQLYLNIGMLVLTERYPWLRR